MEKRKHLFIGLFPLMSLVGGLIETMFLPHAPIYCFTCLILMLLFYIQSMERRISVDPLTKLNNRGQLNRYVSQPSNLRMEGRLTMVIMMDIDRFKAINDNFGHAEGDRALVVVADALKKALSHHSMPSFLGRYGGDEFILIIHPREREEADRLIKDIRAEIKLGAGKGSYPISASAGCDELMGGKDTIQNCIQRADEKLYLDKSYRKLHERRVG